MALLNLPVEIIVHIASYLDETPHFRYASINSLAQTNRRLYDIVDPFLYRLDAQKGGPGDCNHGNAIPYVLGGEGLLNTARKSCQAGAGFDELLSIAVTISLGLEWITMLLDEDMWSERALLGALSEAVEDNRVAVVKELLSRDGVDP